MSGMPPAEEATELVKPLNEIKGRAAA